MASFSSNTTMKIAGGGTFNQNSAGTQDLFSTGPNQIAKVWARIQIVGGNGGGDAPDVVASLRMNSLDMVRAELDVPVSTGGTINVGSADIVDEVGGQVRTIEGQLIYFEVPPSTTLQGVITDLSSGTRTFFIRGVYTLYENTP